MIIKFREHSARSRFFLDFLRSRRSKISFLTILLLITFLSGNLFGLAITEFFGPLDDPATKERIGTVMRTFGIFEPAQEVYGYYKIIAHPYNTLRGALSSPEFIYLDVKFKDYQKLLQKREEAIAQETLFSSEEDFVPATIRHNDVEVKAKIRLKGRLADHWGDEKQWSFRAVTNPDSTLFGMRKFSLQRPLTRGYMNEWYLHKFLNYVGLPSLRYDFVQLVFNGEDLGIYALEEYFDTRLLENNNLREGPIIKFNDDLCWYNEHILGCLEVYSGAAIEPLSVTQTEKDPVLSAEFKKAKDLLEGFRQGTLPPEEVFDIQKMATLYAVSDLFGYHHLLEYTNIRFYYNPITSRLEPLGYDNQNIELLSSSYGLIGSGKHVGITASSEITSMQESLLRDEEFYRAYIAALAKLSEKGYLDKFFTEVEEEADEKMKILYKTYPWYSFDKEDILYENQKYITYMLEPPHGIQAYFTEFVEVSPDNPVITLQVGNVHPLPIEIIGVSYRNETVLLQNAVLLQAKQQLRPVNFTSITLPLPANMKRPPSATDVTADIAVLSRVVGTQNLQKESVYSWEHDPPQFTQLTQKSNIESLPFISTNSEKKQLVVRQGTWTMSEDLVIPKDFTFLVVAGTTLDLVNDARVISYSPLLLLGAIDSPITITSSDHTGQGILIIDAPDTSIFRNVVIRELQEPSLAQPGLTGVITAYQSPIILENVQISNIRSEDAINVIRSPFELSNIVIQNSSSDCLDSDFSTGSVTNSLFANCGNDALDFSGSYAELQGITAQHIGDKAISGGERSNITIANIDIDTSFIGITSKDLSTVSVKDATIKNSTYDFALYQKKPEFGPAQIVASNTETEERHIIEDMSQLILEEETIRGDQKNVYTTLYGE